MPKPRCIALLSIVLFSCSPSADSGHDGGKSPTDKPSPYRLRQYQNKVTTDDGLVISSTDQLTFYDSTLKIDCRFMWTTDNAYRCVPTTLASPGYSYYADSSCNRPVKALYTACLAKIPDYITFSATPETCAATADLPVAIYKNPQALSPTQLYVKTPTGCVAGPNSKDAFPQSNVYDESLLQPVPPNRFIAGRQTTEVH